MERKGYMTYTEFLKELTAWGDRAVRESPGKKKIQEEFRILCTRAGESVQKGGFSPFFYVLLSAGLNREEALFLSAVLYSEISRQEFVQEFWEKFWEQEEDTRGWELFFFPSPVLFFPEETEKGEIRIRLVPRVFLFLYRGILPEQKIPGMYWYCKEGEKLPFLGSSVRQYDRIRRSMEKVKGKKLCYLYGRKGSGRKLNYACLAAALGKGLAVVFCESLHTWQRLQEIRTECMLHRGILVMELPEKEPMDLSDLLEEMAEEETLFFLGEEEQFPVDAGRDRQLLVFAIDPKAVWKDQELFWKLTGEYSWEREEERVFFLQRYAFLPGKMRSVLERAKTSAYSDGRSRIGAKDLRTAVLHAGGNSLKQYAKKIEGGYTMEDLILPVLQKEKLCRIVQRVKNRKQVYEEWGFSEKSAYGNGVSMLFAGPPGTGKTMAAQVMASELDMELYKIELPAVVDKYIGETEKKLNRIFEEVKDSQAILFFDEADVLFSKRTEVREANDRYSNMEVAFLLQKMEEYEGVSILATNYLQNFDEAFRRRISDIVDFPIPDTASRESMWRKMLPERLPVSEELDYPFLARQFPVTGSVIKNALLYGSFLAAESPEQMLTMERILRGLASLSADVF